MTVSEKPTLPLGLFPLVHRREAGKEAREAGHGSHLQPRKGYVPIRMSSTQGEKIFAGSHSIGEVPYLEVQPILLVSNFRFASLLLCSMERLS